MARNLRRLMGHPSSAIAADDRDFLFDVLTRLEYRSLLPTEAQLEAISAIRATVCWTRDAA